MSNDKRNVSTQRSLGPTSGEELAAEIPRVGAPLAHKIKKVSDNIFGRAVKAVVNEYLPYAQNNDAQTFDRFIGETLSEVNAAEINEMANASSIRVAKQPTTGLARLAFPAGASEQDKALILAIEAAINRVLSVANMLVLASERYANGADTSAIPVSFGRTFSVSYLAEKRMHDRKRQGTTAFDALGETAPLTETTLPDGLLNMLDWFLFDNIAIDTVPIFQCATCPNELISILGTSAPRGSDWDTRTRFAAILENIALPLRLRYQFDCDVETHTAAVAFEMPAKTGFPQFLYDPSDSMWERADDRDETTRCVYLLRVTALLAAACFGAGLPIERAVVTAYSQGFDSYPVLSCGFDRFDFTARCMENVRNGAFLNADVRFDCKKALEMLAPNEIAIDFEPSRGFHPIESLRSGLEGRREPLWQDERELDENLARFFHTTHVAELDTRYYLGGTETAQVIDEAQLDSRDSIIVAIAQLESLVLELERDLPALADNERFLYCDHPAARACVNLVEDHVSVAAQAEAYLRTGEFDPERTTITSRVKYVRMPNALFHAYAGLADLYQRIGDYRGAWDMADRCIAFGPTSPTGYLRKADVLAGRHKFNQAANVLIESLQYLVLERDYAAVYQSLALILWHGNRRKTSIALYVLTSYLHGEAAEVAKRFVAKAKRNGVLTGNSPASAEQAARVIAQAGIPLAPTEPARACIAKAAIDLANAGLPLASAPYALYLSNFAEGDGGSISLKSVSSSLQFGIDPMEL